MAAKRISKDGEDTSGSPAVTRAKKTKAKNATDTDDHRDSVSTIDESTDGLDCGFDDVAFSKIDELQDSGINVSDIQKLKEAGFSTALSIVYTTRRDLVNIKGMSDQKIDKISEAARKMAGSGFMSAGEFLKNKCATRMKISTGAPKVDELLGGGVETSTITEFFGEFRCGKTQISHALSVICQLPQNRGGTRGKVCYIDTENTFRPDRIETIAGYYGLDFEKALENITYARCFTSDHMVNLLSAACQKMSEEKYGLLVIDSLMAPFRVDYSGRGDLAERQQLLSRTMGRLQKMSEEFNLAVVITNQVLSDPGGAMVMGAPPKPAGGHIIAHFSTTRVFLRKGRAEQRIMKIYDSPCLPEGETVYEICAKGIQDVSD